MGLNTLGGYYLSRPKGMHERTYERVLGQIFEVEKSLSNMMM
jgi:hypothetical protein